MKKMEKVETHYTLQLEASEYDYLSVIEDPLGRIKIKFLEERWRTYKKTIELLEEIISVLKLTN